LRLFRAGQPALGGSTARSGGTDYLLHYNDVRPHRSLGQLAPAQAGTRPPEPVNLAEFRIRRKQILGGLTHEYYIAA
jgi:putative transposase